MIRGCVMRGRPVKPSDKLKGIVILRLISAVRLMMSSSGVALALLIAWTKLASSEAVKVAAAAGETKITLDNNSNKTKLINFMQYLILWNDTPMISAHSI
jgi:hypothetical protein